MSPWREPSPGAIARVLRRLLQKNVPELRRMRPKNRAEEVARDLLLKAGRDDDALTLVTDLVDGPALPADKGGR